MGFFSHRSEKKKLQKVLDDIQEKELLEEQSDSDKIKERCEQMLENAREIDDGKKEYHIITSYLNDIELIENLPEDRAGQIKHAAENVTKLNKARDQFLNTSKKITDAQYTMIQLHEDDIPDAVKKLRENEKYQATVKRDMQYLEGEKQEWELQKKDRRHRQKTLHKVSCLLLALVATAAVFLLILSFGFQMDMRYAWIGTIAFALLASALILFQLEDGKRTIRQADVNINYAITLLNKVKIKYVNITNAVDYACEKYHVRDARELAYQWDMYQEAVREKEKYRKTNEDLNYYYDKLVGELKKCGLYDARVWIEQPQALVDKKEMVEIKHNLLVRRQKLRSKISQNLEVARKEKQDIVAFLKSHPQEIPKVQELLSSVEQMTDLSAS